MFRTTSWHVAWLLLIFCSLAPAEEATQPSAEKIKAWRAEGPTAVDRLMLEREKLIAAEASRGRISVINDTIDAVAAAKYSHASGLYWYTDEGKARRVAKEQKKPLLMLRLLGNLNEELSCANSRYFRILLYPDDRVRKLLHDQFVLTWKSVRPVPKITVDLGDGRKVERTITGNSVHYVVLPSGEVVDVFPGLYGPVPFAERLEKAAAVLAMRAEKPQTELGEYRMQQIAELTKAWQTDVARYKKLQRKNSEASVEESAVGQVPAAPPSFWDVAAEFHPEYSELSNASRALIAQEAQALTKLETQASTKREVKHGESRKGETSPFDDDGPGFDVGLTPTGPTADLDFRFNKGEFESSLGRLLACVQPALRADTVYSEYRGRFAALVRLDKTAPYTLFDDDGPGFPVAPGKKREPVDKLNDFVYTEIFNYDPNDPWIGLARLDGLAALPKDRGLKRAVEAKPKQ